MKEEYSSVIASRSSRTDEGERNMTEKAAGSTPASWYPDPQNPTQLRYWDGNAWTAHTAPATLPNISTVEVPTPSASTVPSPAEPPLLAPPLGAMAAEPVTATKKPVWKRWWVWGIAAVVVIAAIAAGGGGGKTATAGPTTPTTAPTSGASTPAPSAPPTQAPTPAANPVADAGAALDQQFGTFAPFGQSGVGDSVITLPAGVKAGIAVMTYTGSDNFIAEVLDSNNQSTGDSLANQIGSWKGTAPFGISSLGGAAAKIQIQAGGGSWKIVIHPASAAPPLNFPATGRGFGVYLYTGSDGAWAITHNGSSNFIVEQTMTDGTNNGLVNEIGAYSGTVAPNTGPCLITIQADGVWTFKAG